MQNKTLGCVSYFIIYSIYNSDQAELCLLYKTGARLVVSIWTNIAQTSLALAPTPANVLTGSCSNIDCVDSAVVSNAQIKFMRHDFIILFYSWKIHWSPNF